jgi:hypothetical protein
MDSRGSQKTRPHSPEDLGALNAVDAERWRRIRRDVGMGYAITMKDLSLLVRLTEKLLDHYNPVPELPRTLEEITTAAAARRKRKARA